MQQRFCLCGASVWVRYFFANTRWLAFFYRGDAGEAGTHACPNCGKALNIENLL
ncbi:hypothetical protein LJC26_04140 [Desulfovibrio sp. OttesenSCG-928-O18]|nr:hypothetical protein [Desulfovibrio sp. OttesenSCG-928-O18]